MIETIHAALVALPAFAAEPVPESPEARAERLHPVAAEIWSASANRPPGYTRQQWSAVLGALAWSETRLAAYVQRGECSSGPVGMRCDEGRARGPWQAWQVACHALWETAPGSHDALREGARCASRLMYAAHRRCVSRAPTPLVGAFSGYAGASCVKPWAAKRERLSRLLAARMGG